MTCCFRSSSKHFIQIGLSAPKIISLYFVMVSWRLFKALLLFSDSFDSYIQLFCFFLTTKEGYKSLFLPPFHTTKNPSSSSSSSSLNILHCWLSASMYLHSSHGSFYFVCRRSRSLTLPLHCNTCRMEDLDHENSSLCVLATFLVYHGRICLLLVSVLLSVFQVAATQPHSKLSILKHPLRCLRNIKWHCTSRVLIALRYVIAKYIFRSLDKQWCNVIYLIAYNIPTVLSIIAWHFIGKHHLVYIDCKYIIYLPLFVKVFWCNPFFDQI